MLLDPLPAPVFPALVPEPLPLVLEPPLLAPVPRLRIVVLWLCRWMVTLVLEEPPCPATGPLGLPCAAPPAPTGVLLTAGFVPPLSVDVLVGFVDVLVGFAVLAVPLEGVVLLVVPATCTGAPLASAAAVLAVCEALPQPARATAMSVASTAGTHATRRKALTTRGTAGLSNPRNKLLGA